jgi:hypothetical protein
MRFVLFLLFLVSSAASAQRFMLSDKAEISVITCGPGQKELYSAFGHSAFRVHDPAFGFDAAYNYGVFDFNQPNFYLNFARGFLYYKLGVTEFDNFQYPYVYYNRYIHEQVLDLSQAQKQAIFEALQKNARPENANYRYDYFYNNCATKIRDVVADVLKDSVEFDGSYVKTTYTIRELTDLYLTQQPWGDLGIDIGLGLPMDKIASPYEYMFLPDYVESGFDHAYIIRNEKRFPIVKAKIILNETRDAEAESSIPHPLFFFVPFALFAIALSVFDIKRKKLSSWFDVILFGATGLVGLLLCFLWFFTDHKAAANNLNILWAFPLNIIAVIAFVRNPDWLQRYFAFIAILSASLLLLWSFLPQQLHLFLIPITLAIAARSYTQYTIRKSVKLQPETKAVSQNP